MLNVKAQKSQLNIRTQPPLHEAFASKHFEYISELHELYESYAFILTANLRQKLEKLIRNLKSYSDTVESCKTHNTTYEMGKYCIYEKFSENQIQATKAIMKQIESFFQILQKHVFNSAGRTEI